ncbi:MAG: AAA family ATPase [Candidatus Odinarchaeota archaeon]
MNKKIILVIGYPASGKTQIAKEYETKGYYRLNRDEIGGSLDGLINHLENFYTNNTITSFVLDNTYPTRKSRKSAITWAKKHNFEIHCKYIDIDVGDALYNASKRMINTYGKLLSPTEITKSKDIGVYPPVVIYRNRKIFEIPTINEGFTTVEKIKFGRILDTSIYNQKAVLLDYDGTLRKTKSGAKILLHPKILKSFRTVPKYCENIKQKATLY